ncbi:hypothetical protein ACJX0J_037041, partial [Zea mays]
QLKIWITKIETMIITSRRYRIKETASDLIEYSKENKASKTLHNFITENGQNKKKRVMEKIVMEAKEGDKKRGTKGKIEQMKIMLLTSRYILIYTKQMANAHLAICFCEYRQLFDWRKKTDIM